MMDMPAAPQDTELRNIIDKLAQFVARNGPDFELMTKNKQKGNNKFQFLYGGEHYAYYQYKVQAEHQVLKQQPAWPPAPVTSEPPPMLPSIPPPNVQVQNGASEMNSVTLQIETLQEQIKQSGLNLQAQHTVLLQQQQVQIEVLLSECEIKGNQQDADELGLILSELGALLMPIIDNCTKDSIQTGKSWILQHATDKQRALCIARSLLLKVLQGTPTFTHRLHIIYLVNDVLHHCARKNAADLKDALETVVVPMFCSASMSASSDGERTKLDKLLQLWESKANYLDPATVDAMRHPHDSLQLYKAEQRAKFAHEVQLLAATTQATFEGYRTQHQAFVVHATQQIQELEQRLLPPAINASVPPPQFSLPPPGFFQPPPPPQPPAALFPDFSRPPPGFLAPPPTTACVPEAPPPPLPVQQEELMPTVPYYELPAGLMVPLIHLEDTQFKPIDPKMIRLPPPAPPSERLLAAVEAFYALPSHERPRDSEGWEKLGLYEYYKAKNHARKEKDDAIAAGLREASRSPSPVVVVQEKSPSPPRRRYSSRSPSPHVRSRSRSRTPARKHREHRDRDRERERERRPRRRRTRSKSRSRSRSPSSPLYRALGALSAPSGQPAESIDASNKGHQMLKRMGWGGSGLGVNEQGIDAPISGGDVRDRQDQFKGVGCNLNDPYENFRKNKGAAFITRMKARAEERAQEKQAPDDY